MIKNQVSMYLQHKKPGQFIRISFQSFPTLRASYRQKYEICKISEGTFKCKCDYTHTKRYMEREAQRTEPKRVYTQWAEWTEKNIFKKNISNGKEYLSLVTLPKNSNSKTKWFLKNLITGEIEETTKQKIQEMDIVQPSEFNKKESETILVSLENILWIK